MVSAHDDFLTSEWTEREQIMIEGLARGRPVTEIAEQASISLRQAHRLVKNPRIQNGVRQLCRDTYLSRKNRLLSHWDAMVGVFLEIMENQDEGAMARVAAANSLKSLMCWVEDRDLSETVEMLRERLERVESGLPPHLIELKSDVEQSNSAE